MAEKITLLCAESELHSLNKNQVLSLMKDLLLKKQKIILCLEGLEKFQGPFLESLVEALNEEIYITGDDPRHLIQLPKTKILALEGKFFKEEESLNYLKSFTDFYITNAFKHAAEKTLLNNDLPRLFNRDKKSGSKFFLSQQESLEKIFKEKKLTIVCDFVPRHLQDIVTKMLPHIHQLVCLDKSFMVHEKIVHEVKAPLVTALFVVNQSNELKNIFQATTHRYSILDYCPDNYEYFETQSLGSFLGHETVFKYLADGSLNSFEVL